MKIGIIGTGNMGKILIDALIEGKSIKPEQLTIMNRTMEKAQQIQQEHPAITVVKEARDVIITSNLVFLCIKPLDIPPLLEATRTLFTPEHCLVSITSPLSVEQLYHFVPCHIARIIPSITNRALSGVTLFTFHDLCSDMWKQTLKNLFNVISTPIEISQEITRISSDITSCGPAFFSYILQQYILAASKETAITKEQATILATEMIIGMGTLLEKEIFTLPTLQEKVCVKGGITGEGIAVLEERLTGVFEEVVARTHKKFHQEVEHIKKHINTQSIQQNP